MMDRRTSSVGDRRHDPQLELARALARSLADAVFAVDREGRLTFASPAFETQFGWTEDELRGVDVERHIDSCGLAARVVAEGCPVRVDGLPGSIPFFMQHASRSQAVLVAWP